MNSGTADRVAVFTMLVICSGSSAVIADVLQRGSYGFDQIGLLDGGHGACRMLVNGLGGLSQTLSRWFCHASSAPGNAQSHTSATLFTCTKSAQDLSTKCLQREFFGRFHVKLGSYRRRSYLKGNNRRMLTDIFAYRYANRPIWTNYCDADRILLVQGLQIVAEQLIPTSKGLSPDTTNQTAWVSLHNRLAREFGVESLSPLRWNSQHSRHPEEWGPRSAAQVCKTWLLEDFKHGKNADVFMKERISFVELAFRDHKQSIVGAELSYKSRSDTFKKASLDPTNKLAQLLDALGSAEKVELNLLPIEIDVRNAAFNAACDELNERFRRAKGPLNYHNGFVQIETDELVQKQITEPFWKLVSDPKWKNVEIDMIEAVDRRETNDRDPAFYAAKALESVIKIISDTKRWTTGKEKGPSQFIDNLRSTANGSFIAEWEAEALRHIFSKVRNALSHGPGKEPMAVLTQQQTDWTIEAAMSWTKSLIGRI